MSAAVVAIMAVSIGSCVAIFSMVKAVLIDDWGYADPDRIAIVWHARQNLPGVVGISPSDFRSHQATLGSAEMMAAVTTTGVNLGSGASPSRITCARMTDAMFPLLGVAPARGRWINAADDRSAAKVAVISASLAQRLSGTRDAVDRQINLDGVAHQVVGVMPDQFSFPPEGIQGLAPADCWLPASFTPMELAIPSFNYVLFARLKPSASLAQASEEAHAGAQRIWSTYPAAVQSQVQLTALAVPLKEQVLARSRTPLMLFASAVLVLMLIGCANVSNLMLTAFEARQAELAVRASLGAARWVLVAQLLMESMLLSLAGGLLGLAIAAALLTSMVSANAAAFPRLEGAEIDAAAVAFAVFCSAAAAIAAAFWPAVRASRSSVHLQSTGLRASSRAFGGTLWRRGLIAFEVALAMVVLIVAGVLARSVLSLHKVEPGFKPDGLLTLAIALPESKYRTRDQIVAFGDEMLRQVQRLSAVRSASVSTAPPIGEAAAAVVFAAVQAAGPEYKPALVHAVTADYARTIGLAMRSGRFVTDADATAAAGPVAIVNESFARTLFPDGRVLDRTFSRIGSARPLTIVGVVADTRQAGPLRPGVPAFYVPFAQDDQPIRMLNLALRTDASSSALMPEIRRALVSLDPEVPPFAVKTGPDLVNGTIAVHRFSMLVIGVFAAFALILAISGLYAVLAQSVQQARRDFGIRKALGATSGRIARSVLGRAIVPAVIGIILGGLAASAAAGLISSQLFDVAPNDPMTFAASASIVLLISILVVLAPALKAASVDPAALLRHDSMS